ncbi:MAG: nucleotidyltransferase domain-containing protein [Chitinophagales bacterium]
MARFTEATLQAYTKPPSHSEENQLKNAERMVREAIKVHPKLKELSIETFGQGSYANNTNVKLNSDIDINVRLSSVFFYNIPQNKKATDFGLNSPTSYTFKEYKNAVQKALENKFGVNEVVRNDKCITVKGNTYRVETDVVPTWKHRQYNESGTFSTGAKFISDGSKSILNYPLQHIDNGIIKNKHTQKRFKRNVRIIDLLLYKTIDYQ